MCTRYILCLLASLALACGATATSTELVQPTLPAQIVPAEATSEPPVPTFRPTNTYIPTYTPTPVPVSPEEALRANIEEALGDSNRGISPRISEYRFEPNNGLIYVKFALADSLFLSDNARREITTVLEQVSGSSLAFTGVDVLGTFTLVDVYGNTHEGIVLSLYYSRDTIAQINFGNFNPDNVYRIADNIGMIHPDFQD